MKELTHLSLFSGIGGLDLAAEWAGIKTVGQCEWADYPTKVLEKHWPDVPRWRDIRTLTGEDFYERTGLRTVDVISGGFPCQPFSTAGKRRGKEDDRFLWPEMVRVIKELRPTWVVGENVAGIVSMALDDILSDLEAEGYKTRTFLIPAHAVGAPHRRYRTAIVGYSEHNGLYAAEVGRGTKKTERGQQEREKTPCEPSGTGKSRNGKDVGRAETMENTNSIGCIKPENVCEQQRRAEPVRTSKTLANTKSVIKGRLPVRAEEAFPGPCIGREDVQHTNGAGCKKLHAARKPSEQGFLGRGCNEGNVCHAAGQGLQDGTGKQVGRPGAQEPQSERPDSNVPDTDNRSWPLQRNGELSAAKKVGSGWSYNGDGKEKYVSGQWWAVEPNVGRVANGISARVDRLKCLGNAVVPQQFYPVFKAIAEIEVM